MVRAVSFDVGATLLRPYPSFGELFVACCRESQVVLPSGAAEQVEVFADAYFAELRARGVAYSVADDVSRQTWTSLYRTLLERFGVGAVDRGELAERIFATFLNPASYRLFDDALPVVTEVKTRGYLVGVISNWEAWLPQLLGHTRLAELMDFSVVSGEVGWEKPDRRIFDAAVGATGVLPSEILHVGDSVNSDVLGARAAGLRAVLLDRAGRYGDLDIPRIATLYELLELPDLAGNAVRSGH